MMQLRYYIEEPDSMLAFGSDLSKCCPSRLVVYLSGELGSGKTTLCRGFIQGRGHSGRVPSPTYTLVETYSLDNGVLHHFDLYRLSDPEELEYMGIRDYFIDNGLSLIEWPEKGRAYLPQADLMIKLGFYKQGREVILLAKAKSAEAVLNDLSGQIKPC